MGWIDCCGRTKCRLTMRESQEEKGAAVNQSRSESDRFEMQIKSDLTKGCG